MEFILKACTLVSFLSPFPLEYQGISPTLLQFFGEPKTSSPKFLPRGAPEQTPSYHSGNRTISSLYLLLGKRKEATFSSLFQLIRGSEESAYLGIARGYLGNHQCSIFLRKPKRYPFPPLSFSLSCPPF